NLSERNRFTGNLAALAGLLRLRSSFCVYAPEQKSTTKRRVSAGSWRSKSRPPRQAVVSRTSRFSLGFRRRFGAHRRRCLPWDTGGMKTVELYARVRRAVLVEGKSRRAVAREFDLHPIAPRAGAVGTPGLARKTVRKMLEYSLPPGYQRQQPVRRPKLG